MTEEIDGEFVRDMKKWRVTQNGNFYFSDMVVLGMVTVLVCVLAFITR